MVLLPTSLIFFKYFWLFLIKVSFKMISSVWQNLFVSLGTSNIDIQNSGDAGCPVARRPVNLCLFSLSFEDDLQLNS